MGRSVPSKSRSNSGVSAKSRGHVGGPPSGQKQLAPEHRREQGREPFYPLADLRLADPKEKAHDLLGRVALEIEKDEEQLVPSGGQLALVRPRPKGALAHPAIVGVLAPLGHQQRLHARFQAHELAQIQRGERAQKPWLAENNVHVHAPTRTENFHFWLHPIESNNYLEKISPVLKR